MQKQDFINILMARG